MAAVAGHRVKVDEQDWDRLQVEKKRWAAKHSVTIRAGARLQDIRMRISGVKRFWVRPKPGGGKGH